MTMRMLRLEELDKGVTIHCDGHIQYVVYPDAPGQVFTTTGVELQGADLDRARQVIQRTANKE